MRLLALTLSYLIGFSGVLALQNRMYEINENSGIGEPFKNPTQTKFFIYVPGMSAGNTLWYPIVVVPHYCGADADTMFKNTLYAQYADQYKYIVIFPSAPRGCWDVSSKESLMHDGGGDSTGISLMVKWVLRNYRADPNRVYVTGLSSGGMMTQVLCATYPDMFRAGSAWASVPPGCFTHLDYFGSGDLCPSGGVRKTGQQWGDIIRQGYPGYNGPRPRLQLWHGELDRGIDYTNLGESIKAWTNVLKVTATTNSTNSPIGGYTKINFAGPSEEVKLEAYSAANVEHVMPFRELDVLKWFGIVPCDFGTRRVFEGRAAKEYFHQSVVITGTLSGSNRGLAEKSGSTSKSRSSRR
ncbi:hypothetical protein H072_3640 [Dactylellina haptotyla CBS 200.50]|uniref:Carboxylic ester hydrolase n=1 Tax=Dactylellina haptotyla (strain CBS 200.50) TaxID=1284197 RepID=S8C3Z2_DACHA|nr:hypothetical protein H072_3640 [Dactylellina haptotyla CBS 200.50]